MKLQKIAILLLTVIMIISCKNSTTIDLGNGYKLINSASFNDLTIVTEQNIVAIDGHILEFEYDSNFVIASQRPRDSVPGISTMTYDRYQEAFENSKFLQYWIINKKQESLYSLDSISMTAKYSNVYGPYNKDEYLKKRQEIGVPTTLKIE